MIEDTSFVIDVLGGDEGALDLLEVLEAENRSEKVSAITALELYEGVTRSSKPDAERARVLRVLDSKHVVAADLGIMQRAGTLSGELINEGERIDREDCVVAATALREGEPVVTRNARHFERIPQVEVRTY